MYRIPTTQCNTQQLWVAHSKHHHANPMLLPPTMVFITTSASVFNSSGRVYVGTESTTSIQRHACSIAIACKRFVHWSVLRPALML
jgi:hypothetical protein